MKMFKGYENFWNPTCKLNRPQFSCLFFFITLSLRNESKYKPTLFLRVREWYLDTVPSSYSHWFLTACKKWRDLIRTKCFFLLRLNSLLKLSIRNFGCKVLCWALKWLFLYCWSRHLFMIPVKMLQSAFAMLTPKRAVGYNSQNADQALAFFESVSSFSRRVKVPSFTSVRVSALGRVDEDIFPRRNLSVNGQILERVPLQKLLFAISVWSPLCEALRYDGWQRKGWDGSHHLRLAHIHRPPPVSPLNPTLHQSGDLG